MYILIIGDNYGSFYHKEKTSKEIRESVTLKEFKRALEQQIPKEIFINKFVEYDYRNYRRHLEQKLNDFFSKNEVEPLEIENITYKIKEEFDNGYYFPKKQYKYIFHFLDCIDVLKTGNAYHKFETSEDIKEGLKKQWAGYLHDNLNKKDEKKDNKDIQKIMEKLNKIENIIEAIAQNTQHSEGKEVIFNFENFRSVINYEKVEEFKVRYNDLIKELVFCKYFNQYNYEESTPRVSFKILPTKEGIKEWMISLEEVLKEYKWTKYVSINKIFGDTFDYIWYINCEEIEYSLVFVLEFYNMYKSIPDEEDSKMIPILDIFKKVTTKKSEEFDFSDDDEFPF